MTLILTTIFALSWAQPREPAGPLLPLAFAGPLVVVWHEGQVTRAPLDASAAPTPPLVGELLSKDTRVEAQAASRLLVLEGGHRLLFLEGPGTWIVGAAEITATATGAHEPREPRVEALASFREGPLPTLESGASQPLLEDMSLPPTLLVTSPIVPVTRHALPAITWHWPYAGGRFDLSLEEIDGDGVAQRTIERWANLAGREHRLWAPLERGRAYRLRIAHRAEEDQSPIADERAFQVLTPEEIAAVDGALESLDALQHAAGAYRPEVDVLRARLLESHGLWDEAEKVWTGLALLFPGRDELLHHALRLHARSLLNRTER